MELEACMRCSKVVICNRSRATGKGMDACIGDYEAQAQCPEWVVAISLERTAKALQLQPGFTADIDKARAER